MLEADASVTTPRQSAPSTPLRLDRAASLAQLVVLEELGSSANGLSTAEAALRLARYGPNALRSHQAQPWSVLARQLRNPLLMVLLAAAAVSAFTGNPTDASIIAVIVTLSVGLGFFNEYRSEQAVQSLHDTLRHTTTVTRDGAPAELDVVDLVPGDVITLRVGDIVPADVRLLRASELQCDEGLLTGESMPTVKGVEALTGAHGELELSSCAFMGTVVQQGAATAVVVQTGADTAFGRIAVGLSERPAQTAFQVGLAQFSTMLAWVAGALTVSIFAVNLVLQRPFIDALLFSLAIAIGLTPQLLPAIVTVSLSTGARRLARRKVLVKHLVSIEDLGNITTLFTDKTGTLTEGRITFDVGLDPDGVESDRLLLLGLLCNEAVLDGERVVSGNQLDVALWERAGSSGTAFDARRWVTLAAAPFDHERRVASVRVKGPDGAVLMVVKGEPERLLERCAGLDPAVQMRLDQLFDAGARVVAVATKRAPLAEASTGGEGTDGRGTDAALVATPSTEDESHLHFEGFLTFVDRPKAEAAESLRRLRELDISVKVITGDNERVARKVCADLGLEVDGTLNGAQLDQLDDEQLAVAIATTTVFARIGPEQKARVVRIQRSSGADVAFMGDGVNDAMALHHADVGISVDSATDVAKDAADIVLLERDLGVLADGVIEGRRIFANTMKYILMATSSNFGNMFSAAGASLFLSYLPMLPSQILLNNLLYDVGQMTIPTDNVDPEMLRRPSQWDIHFIRRFMAVFGPISSLFDFATFAVLLGVFHAGRAEFRSGWFVESLATQSLIIFVIRTRRVPFLKSRPGTALLASTLTGAAIGAVLPFSPLAGPLGFTRLPAAFFAVLAGLFATYLVLAEAAKRAFYAALTRAAARPDHRHHPVARRTSHERRVLRRARRFTHSDSIERPVGERPISSAPGLPPEGDDPGARRRDGG